MVSSQGRAQIPDKVLMYASLFSYEPQERVRMSQYEVNYNMIGQFEGSRALPPNSVQTIRQFEDLDEQGQRTQILDNNQTCETLLRVLFAIVEKVNSDEGLLRYALTLINGIVEDRRTRIKRMVLIQKAKNQERHMDLIGILLSFITKFNGKMRQECDMASHTLAMLIEAVEYKNCEAKAKAFLSHLIDMKDATNGMSREAFTHCLMFLLKTNELAKKFVDSQGMIIYQKMLLNECIQNGQIAYNVCCGLWILTALDAAMEHFTDFKLSIIEHVSKILDYFNKEKIVRIICMMFDVSLN